MNLEIKGVMESDLTVSCNRGRFAMKYSESERTTMTFGREVANQIILRLEEPKRSGERPPISLGSIGKRLFVGLTSRGGVPKGSVYITYEHNREFDRWISIVERADAKRLEFFLRNGILRC